MCLPDFLAFLDSLVTCSIIEVHFLLSISSTAQKIGNQSPQIQDEVFNEVAKENSFSITKYSLSY